MECVSDIADMCIYSDFPFDTVMEQKCAICQLNDEHKRFKKMFLMGFSSVLGTKLGKFYRNFVFK